MLRVQAQRHAVASVPGLPTAASVLTACRSEFGVRSAIFFSAAAFSGSFGGLLAAAIEKMNGMGGRPGWAWIFILEGTVTVLFGVASIVSPSNIEASININSISIRSS